MGKTIRKVAFLAVLAALNSLGTATASPAGLQPYPCKTGTIQADAAVIDGYRVTIPGVMDCSVSEPGRNFTLVVFEPGYPHGYYHSGLLHDYSSAGGRTTFNAVGWVEDFDDLSDVGICLMPDTQTRLSCVYVTMTWSRTVTPLSTSDSLVAGKPVLADPLKAPFTDGVGCSSCWVAH